MTPMQREKIRSLMRAEIETLSQAVKQSLELLRRHL